MGRHIPHRPPARALALLEGSRATAELAVFRTRKQTWLRDAARGDGHGVLVLPGFTASDTSTGALRSFLHEQNFRPHRWKLGVNLGPTRRVVEGVEERVRALSEAEGPISVIGWSLGGIYAREIARRAPEHVRQVITLGTPFRIENRSQTWASGLYERLSRWHVEEEVIGQAYLPPPPVPSSSIYSRTDGIVSWIACLDPEGGPHENIEVRSSHCGLGHSLASAWAIADRLAQAPGEWAPFSPPPRIQRWYPKPVWWMGPVESHDTPTTEVAR